MQRWFIIFIIGLAMLAVSCSERTVSVPLPATAAAPTQQVFEANGTIVELLPAEKSVRIQHEAIPDYMPAMTMPFDVKDTLLAMPNAPTNWHLFTISVDPEWDTPGRLKAYAAGMKHNPQHWSFLTGDLVEITAIAEQVGEVFARDENGSGINHNLRTV